jgi:hypothetical protein
MNDKQYILEITENGKVIETIYFRHWQEREIYKFCKGLR